MAKKKIIEIKKHILRPVHTKLSESDKKKILAYYHVTEKELPKIYKDDAALMRLNLKEGDVIKIERDSQTAGGSIFYRVVVNG